MTSAEVVYPAPRVLYLGSSFVVHPVDISVGTARVGQVPSQSIGIRSVPSDEDGIPTYTLRPEHKLRSDEKDPCDFQFDFAYHQNGLEWDMVFSLKSDDQGGVVGTAAAVEVDSNYPDIPMTLSKFTFNQGGIGYQKRYILPADYAAELRFKFWLQHTDPAVDGSIRFETFYVKMPESAREGRPDPVLVSTSKSTLYPSFGGPEARVLGHAYELSRNGGPVAETQAVG